MSAIASPSVSLVGHPYTPIGMGEHVRATFRALRSVARTPTLRDVYRLTPPDETQRAELTPFETDALSDINVFHINGDEVEQILAHIGGADRGAYNVVYPLWELPRYPAAWARQLERFDEIWAPSRFIEQGIEAQTSKPVFHMPLTCEVVMDTFLGRRYFDIPESAYAFLFFFDLKSYVSRKNPQAVIAAFRELVRTRPDADVVLVIKVNGGDRAPEALTRLRDALADLDERALLIDRSMSDDEMKNLVRCCDCFVSLHRSEGFGFGIAQAMYLDKPVIATGHSGNMDFMTEETSLVVGYRLVPVEPDAYPHWQDQHWAEPSVDDAAAHMRRLVDSPSLGHAIGRRAGRHVRARFGFRNAGVRAARRIDAITRTLDGGEVPHSPRSSAEEPCR